MMASDCLSAPADPPELLDRKRLAQRWQCGSEAFFWRHEASGALCARSDGTKVRYAWEDIWAFEGGVPPDDLRAEYQCDLLTEAQAARLCWVEPSYILTAARSGDLPTRRVGRAYRFVPAEIQAWHARRFMNRKSWKTRRKPRDE